MKREFLMDEIKMLQECKGIGLPNFVPSLLSSLFCKVKLVSDTPFDFVNKVWCYLEDVFVQVLLKHSDNYPSCSLLLERESLLMGKLIRIAERSSR